MGEKSNKHLEELLKSFDSAMLITRASGDQIHARPMAIAGVEGPSTIWFVTDMSAPKVHEIQTDSRASATFQSSNQFVALSGRADLVRSREKVAQLWKPAWNVWFPEGKDDPSLVLIRLHVTDAELWDNAGAKGIRYAFEAAKAVLTGETPTVTEEQHERIKHPH